MKYIVDSNKNIEQAATDLEAAVINHSFGVLHIHDLKATMNKKGVPFEPECRIFEVCNPKKAFEVLSEDMAMNMALPCRISVWQEDGNTKIGMIQPKPMLEMLSSSEKLSQVADEVQTTLTAIIDEAAA
ncbi:MAG: DUF302 domain-containing protein [Ghiorsea sp.]|nr:DUF302 domain-containing protein [Ghiorsea sp.]MDQ6980128.1 DUF302 domain-containing protein [Ghiorsea sp.]MDQ7058907.1 DUF302 domain-containing protein [Ghiorsea sp.]